MESIADNIVEKRDYPRVKKLYLISYLNKENGRQISSISMGRTLDLSASGIRVEVFQTINIDSEMELEIIRDETLFKVTGSVLRVTSTGDEIFVLGIQFDEVQEELVSGL